MNNIKPIIILFLGIIIGIFGYIVVQFNRTVQSFEIELDKAISYNEELRKIISVINANRLEISKHRENIEKINSFIQQVIQNSQQ